MATDPPPRQHHGKWRSGNPKACPHHTRHPTTGDANSQRPLPRQPTREHRTIRPRAHTGSQTRA
ncbi:hypothetical protein CSQ85_12845 [Bifidobacterium rousetti]|nr:hypothetical protein CSQ85_12845 [Bifidobacterium rousetti]